jgi:hypothetical protein
LKEHRLPVVSEVCIGAGMSQQPDIEYYIARLRAEREAAAAAASEEAREAHRALAIRYAGLLMSRGHSAALEGADAAADVTNPPPNFET